jgi:TatA/E family protein of Tat protein translocase
MLRPLRFGGYLQRASHDLVDGQAVTRLFYRASSGIDSRLVREAGQAWLGKQFVDARQAAQVAHLRSFYPQHRPRPAAKASIIEDSNMNLPLAFLQMTEIMWIAVIILVLFGGSRIPALMRSIGRGAGELQKGIEEGKTLMNKSINDPEPDTTETKA